MRRARARGVCAVLLAAVAGCRTPPPAPPPPPPPPDDSAADWRALVIAPFGSALKEIPVALHEVLLFRDDAHKGAADDAECYATDAAAPSLLGRTPEDYLLCFKHDRLSRIQASVRLTAAEAPDVFAQACAAWLRHATPAEAACEGRDGAIRFVGRLAEQSDPAENSDADTALSLTLDSPDP
jgi:hypothetical protein